MYMYIYCSTLSRSRLLRDCRSWGRARYVSHVKLSMYMHACMHVYVCACVYIHPCHRHEQALIFL